MLVEFKSRNFIYAYTPFLSVFAGDKVFVKGYGSMVWRVAKVVPIVESNEGSSLLSLGQYWLNEVKYIEIQQSVMTNPTFQNRIKHKIQAIDTTMTNPYWRKVAGYDN